MNKTSHWLHKVLRDGIHDPYGTRDKLIEMNGGYVWDCLSDTRSWITSADVRKALHLDKDTPGASRFSYRRSGPASITLYPSLVKTGLRFMIFNGDADACVPYNGNAMWIRMLEEQGILTETKPWSPWYMNQNNTCSHTGSRESAPECKVGGGVTMFQPKGATTSFSWVTVRLSGHMVPQFRPEAAFRIYSRFLAGEF